MLEYQYTFSPNECADDKESERPLFDALALLREGKSFVSAQVGDAPKPAAAGDAAKPLTEAEKAEQKEKERVAQRAKEFESATDDVERAGQVFTKFPEKIALKSDNKSIAIKSDNFAKIAESIPYTHLHPGLRALLEGTRGVTLDGNQVKLEGKVKTSLSKAEIGVDATFNYDNTTFDIEPDKADPNKLHLRNIQNVQVTALGANAEIKSASVTLKKDEAGKHYLELSVAKPVPVTEKKDDVLSYLKSGYNKLAALAPEIQPIRLDLSEQDAKRIEKVFGELKQWTSQPDKRDATRFIDAIAGTDLKSVLGGLFTGVTAVEKDGGDITVTRKQADAFNIGGVPLKIGEKVQAKASTAADGTVKLSDIKGISTSLPLPTDVARALGIGETLDVGLTELSLGPKDKNGHRMVTFKTNSMIESVSLKVGADLQPVKDKDGNVTLDAVFNKEGKVSVSVTFNPDKLNKAGGPDFALKINSDSKETAKFLHGVFGQRIDENVEKLLGGVKSINKVGDRVEIHREKATAHAMGELKLEAAQKITFKLDPNPKNLKVTELEGVKITGLPGAAQDVYRKKLPIEAKTIVLRSPDKDGNRELYFEGDRVISDAIVSLDAGMNPTKVDAVVENPIKAYKEAMPGRWAALDEKYKGKTFRIVVHSNGSCDLGGLGEIGKMALNAGDFHSPEGLLLTAGGYAAQKINPTTSGRADMDLIDKIIDLFK